MTCPAGSFRCMDCDAVEKEDVQVLVEVTEEDIGIFVCPKCFDRRDGNRLDWLDLLESVERMIRRSLRVKGGQNSQERREEMKLAAGTYSAVMERFEYAEGTGFFYSPQEQEEDTYGDDTSDEVQAVIDASLAHAHKSGFIN